MRLSPDGAPATPMTRHHARTPCSLTCAVAAVACASAGCATLPETAAERGLYLDLRKIVATGEDSGWTVDSVRLDAGLEPALRSTCQVHPRTRAALDAWLVEQIALNGGPARASFASHHDLGVVSESLSLERVRELLRHAEARAAVDCPFWLGADPNFVGVQGDFRRWVVLAETQAFLTVMVPGPVPAVGGGGRLFLGRGLGPRTTLALGVDVAGSGTFIPQGNHGIDAFATVATPVLFRFSEFTRAIDVELAPVVRFSPTGNAWPPGGRVELGWGFSSVTLSSFMSYFMFYGGYEVHGLATHDPIDHTIQLGTRIAVDWAPGRD
jgi:hypothetical protein